MDLYYDRAEIQISLENLKYNIENIYKKLNSNKKIIAVVKTDAYGHGASAIASFLEPLSYIWGFAVATVEEGVTLRRQGITKSILVLGATFEREIKKSVSYNLTSNIFDRETAVALSEEAKRQNKTVNFHLSVDSGMGRLGFRNIDSDLNKVKEIASLSNTKIEGLFTHFSKADEKDSSYTNNQIKYFEDFAKKIEDFGIKNVMKHLSNSAGVICDLGTQYDAVRAGIAMYGLYPSKDIDKFGLKLKPILSLKSKVIFVKDVDKGTSISYGGTFITDKATTIATIPIGYGDGYPRALSSKGYVLINGQKAPILGRVCMDQFMVDVSDIPNVKIGDVVTLIGQDKDMIITIDTLSEFSDRFNYEFVCDLNKRIPRGYYESGERVDTLDYFYK